MSIVMLKRLKSSSVSDVHYASDKKRGFRELIVPMRGGPDIRLAITCHI